MHTKPGTGNDSENRLLEFHQQSVVDRAALIRPESYTAGRAFVSRIVIRVAASATRNNGNRSRCAQIARKQVLVNLSEGDVLALTAGPVGSDHHAMPQVVLNANRGLIAACQREMGGIDLHTLLGVVNIGIRERPAAGRVGLALQERPQRSATADSRHVDKLTDGHVREVAEGTRAWPTAIGTPPRLKSRMPG